LVPPSADATDGDDRDVVLGMADGFVATAVEQFIEQERQVWLT
jgi:hypothetical protein